MKKVIDLFHQIQNTSSLNEKKQIIISNSQNDLFRECLRFLLDGNIVTGISDKKLNKKVEPRSELAPYYLCMNSTFIEVMNYLKDHNTGTDDDIYEIQCFLHGHEEDRLFYEAMITKKFRLGADAKLVNACIPSLIPVFDVMLGTSIEKVKIPNNVWFSLSQKLNGNRCVYYKGELYTRQGKKYTGLEHIRKDIELLSKDRDFVYDGELIYKNKEGLSDSEAFQKGTGIANSKSESKEELKLVLFDLLPTEEFEKGKSSKTYKERKKMLLDLKKHETENLQIVPMLYEGTEQSMIWKWLDYAEQHDMEGLMLSLDAPYECKRTKNLLKVKTFYTYDLQVIDVEEGDGRNKGTLGALIVQYKNNTVKVGTGYTDEERRELWDNRKDIIGRVIEVKYKEITIDKKTKLASLQFPVFVRIREDGKEVSDD